jgi:PAS domain S-box-containing protein
MRATRLSNGTFADGRYSQYMAQHRSTERTALRRKAEEILNRTPSRPDRNSKEDADRLLREVTLRRIELEIENAELRAGRRDMQEQLRQYADLYDAAPAGYLSLNERGIVVRANLAAAALLGVDRDDLIGSPFAVFLHSNPAAFHAHMRRVLAAQEKAGCEVMVKRNDKPPLSIHLDSRSSTAEGGRVMRTIITDITGRKHLEEELAGTNDELERKIARQAAEFYRLNERLHEEIEERRRLEQDAHGGATRPLSRSADALYDRAPIALCVLDTDLRYLRVNQKMAEINGMPAAEHIGRSLTDVAPDLAAQALRIAGQVVRSGRPVTNVELTGETGAEPGLIKVWREDWHPVMDDAGRVCAIDVLVEDITERTCMEEGISEQRAHSGDEKERLSALAGGVRDEVRFSAGEAHRGRASSDTGVQPEGRAGNAARRQNLDEFHRACRIDPVGTPAGKERILLVDDEQSVVKIVTMMLEHLGSRVTAFAGAAEALKAFEADPAAFDLVITDQLMPGMSGNILAGKILAIRNDMPIILCTGDSESIKQLRTQETGIREFVTKPIVIAELTAAINRALGRSPLAAGA